MFKLLHIIVFYINLAHISGQHTDVYSELLEMKKGFKGMQHEISLLKEENKMQKEENKMQKEENKMQKEENKMLKMKVKNIEGKIEQCGNISKIDKMKRLLLDGDMSPNQQVAFYAYLTKNIDNIGNHQTIIFDYVQTNHGNAYKSDGEFLTKVSGTYFFIWTISNGDNTYMQSELVVNGQVFGQIFSDAAQHTDWAVSTAFTIVYLNPEDRVWIRSGTVHSGHVNGVGFGTSSFAGFRIW